MLVNEQVVEGVAIHSVSAEFLGYGWDLAAIHIVDGSGLSGNPQGHAQIQYPGGDSWQTDTSTGQGSVTLNLGSERELTRLHVWNLNFYAPYNGRGGNNVTIKASANATDWTQVGSYDFAIATGLPDDPGFDLDAAMWPTTQYLQIEIQSNFGSSDNAGHVGLSEVRCYERIEGPTNARPMWTWEAAGGGNGTFRFKLDDTNLAEGATETADLVYTPTVGLSLGTHTLYVQERDDQGDWSEASACAFVVEPDKSDRWVLH